jgi:hypothetical protein
VVDGKVAAVDVMFRAVEVELLLVMTDELVCEIGEIVEELVLVLEDSVVKDDFELVVLVMGEFDDELVV